MDTKLPTLTKQQTDARPHWAHGDIVDQDAVKGTNVWIEQKVPFHDVTCGQPMILRCGFYASIDKIYGEYFPSHFHAEDAAKYFADKNGLRGPGGKLTVYTWRMAALWSAAAAQWVEVGIMPESHVLDVPPTYVEPVLTAEQVASLPEWAKSEYDLVRFDLAEFSIELDGKEKCKDWWPVIIEQHGWWVDNGVGSLYFNVVDKKAAAMEYVDRMYDVGHVQTKVVCVQAWARSAVWFETDCQWHDAKYLNSTVLVKPPRKIADK